MPLLKRSEWDCKCGCGFNNLDPQFLERLLIARYRADTPFIINSGCRCEEHNRAIGGRVVSAHMHGKAADIKARNSVHRFSIVDSLLFAGFKRIGIYKTFIHVDADQTKPAGVMWYGN